ncbi:monovalent cation:proton antiporter-2 (CPA2) family protein [Sphingosinicella sp. LHD-64]|uniref:monovalent cation:proton antiporter-2 (CPA2) family protein n=1 Tax=Sphingosinicella sp. LHD-64 TaxID=3072139 RepID=UPI00280E7B24|nr:monovalent cation:proton antiporter-2 (CPA2) family protein [Sphingosinicella sp. LHD-64]MDQ8754952.1 monovalent cation:proton antiporter-2 (CPA2) family protein [Sphingosinicella sp. LHD-64]
MAEAAHGVDLTQVVVLLGAGVIAAPLFKRLGLGSVLGYLAAGVVVGPFGLRLVTEATSILHVAELGVVLFLFIVGLEMRPSRLWGLRRQIFGLGLVQVGVCAALLTSVGVLTGFPVSPSFVAGAGFVLTSTAIVMQLLADRREMATPAGQRIVSILLLEDLAIVPLLAAVAFLAPIAPGSTSQGAGLDWAAIGIGFASIAGLVIAGRYLLNPMFRFLAIAEAREAMTAAALLVVLGAALAMQLGGLSMAMGAFLAGVLLSESTFRHQLEADIEPFRGILLGLFFLAVGMSLDLGVVAASLQLIAFYVAAYMIVKGVAIYAVARLLEARHPEALERAVMMAQGGEFAFVLYAAATAAGIITGEQNAILTAIVIISMVLTPLAMIVLKRVQPAEAPSTDGVDTPDGLTGSVLIIGFGRVGQIASQLLLERGHSISIIDTDVEMIEAAAEFDFKVYYGDGARLDILHAAGAGQARAVLVCVDNLEAATRIVEAMKAEYPLVPVLARANDRRHAAELVRVNADYQIRETFESSLILGGKALEVLGASDDEIMEITARIRARDDERFALELAEGQYAGRALFSGKATAEDATER